MIEKSFHTSYGTSIPARIVQIMDSLALPRNSPPPKPTLRQVSGRPLRLTAQQLAHVAANHAEALQRRADSEWGYAAAARDHHMAAITATMTIDEAQRETRADGAGAAGASDASGPRASQTPNPTTAAAAAMATTAVAADVGVDLGLLLTAYLVTVR